MTPEIIAQAYKDAGVTTQKDIIDGVKQAITRVEARIDQAYETYPPPTAAEMTRKDRRLLKAQLIFLNHLESKN